MDQKLIQPNVSVTPGYDLQLHNERYKQGHGDDVK